MSHYMQEDEMPRGDYNRLELDRDQLKKLLEDERALRKGERYRLEQRIFNQRRELLRLRTRTARKFRPKGVKR